MSAGDSPGAGDPSIQLWVSVNERDDLGDNLVPDYITHVQDGGFYGWPWFYMGGTQDPRHIGKHPELKDKVITPDVLIQPHSASLELVFHEGSAYAAEHGSWNRNLRTGYKVILATLQPRSIPLTDAAMNATAPASDSSLVTFNSASAGTPNPTDLML